MRHHLVFFLVLTGCGPGSYVYNPDECSEEQELELDTPELGGSTFADLAASLEGEYVFRWDQGPTVPDTVVYLRDLAFDFTDATVCSSEDVPWHCATALVTGGVEVTGDLDFTAPDLHGLSIRHGQAGILLRSRQPIPVAWQEAAASSLASAGYDGPAPTHMFATLTIDGGGEIYLTSDVTINGEPNGTAFAHATWTP